MALSPALDEFQGHTGVLGYPNERVVVRLSGELLARMQGRRCSDAVGGEPLKAD
jgi:hypothetical protein